MIERKISFLPPKEHESVKKITNEVWKESVKLASGGDDSLFYPRDLYPGDQTFLKIAIMESKTQDVDLVILKEVKGSENISRFGFKNLSSVELFSFHTDQCGYVSKTSLGLGFNSNNTHEANKRELEELFKTITEVRDIENFIVPSR